MREARGPAWTDWLVERAISALSGIDTRSLVLHLRDRGAMRAVVGRRRLLGRRSAGRGRGAAVDGRTRARRRSLDARAVRRTPSTGAPASRSSTTAASARSSDGSSLRARPSRSSRTTSTPTSCGASTAFCSRTAPATRGRFTRRSPPCASCSAACPCSASAWATSCSPSRAATRPSSSSSATAAPTTRCSSGDRPCARHEPEPRLRRRAERGPRGDARLALRRHGRGPRFPGAARALACSSIPRRAPARTTPGRFSSAGSRR